eukprot:CAMPEP_0202357946 /NCGR_PEP_ID=MMETSP1126-20121109/11777_1 /ASSEMBLY_ACC=CAM_ASM_000457 /TAXON_ID=3047 /ORGANISM="Dunaliella tertiolecta, Strain CCMP1320" /LENGTH=162 /DNA_ID=CAMNT_0048950943 /DNA_START=342 /DNA_END=830 /DNA_ORIENTATION=+
MLLSLLPMLPLPLLSELACAPGGVAPLFLAALATPIARASRSSTTAWRVEGRCFQKRASAASPDTFAATAMRWLMPTTPPRNPRPYRLQASEPASAAVGAGVAVGAGTDAKADAVADAWSSDTDPDMPALLDAIVGGGCVCGWLEVEGVWEVWLGGGWCCGV